MPCWSGRRTTRSPSSPWALGAQTPQMGGCFPMSSTPRSTTGVRTRPRSGSSASGPAAWRSSRAGNRPCLPRLDYGRETLPILDHQAAHYGFTVQHLAVTPPGLDQKATWLRVKVAQPDWVLLRSTGVMTPTALKEAAHVGVPRDKIVGPHPTCAEQDMVPAGAAAMGFICTTWYGTGTHFPLIQEMLQYVYARGKGAGPERDVGTGHWIRGVLRALLATEGIRTAMRHFGHQPLTGAQVQWGLEHLSLTAARLKALGAEGLLSPFTLSCRDHEGGGGVKFQQWDGTQWTVLTDWIAPDQALVRPLVEASAAKYAQEKGITPRDCP